MFDDAAIARDAFERGDFGLVVVDEPGDGSDLVAPFLGADGPVGCPVLCLSALPYVVEETLGARASDVQLVPAPVDGLMLRMVFEDLQLPWGRVPADRPALRPPVPDRPWGKAGMVAGTVDAAGAVVPVAEPPDSEG